jgi:hypothetical protein
MARRFSDRAATQLLFILVLPRGDDRFSIDYLVRRARKKNKSYGKID